MSDWEQDCLYWRGKILTGVHAHYCPDWDFLPVDETTQEYSSCTCKTDPEYDADGRSFKDTTMPYPNRRAK